MVVSIYFEKKRAFASSIASCGGGVGVLIMAPIFSLLENNFGWAYTMMMIGAIVLACVPLGILFKPIANNKVARPNLQHSEKALEKNYGAADLDSINEDTTCTRYCPLLPKCPYIVYDAVFITCLLSNLLMNIGFAVPYVYTMVSIIMTIFLI